MNYLTEAIRFLLDPAHWPGPDGIAERLRQHLAYTMISGGIAVLIGLPVGLAIGHTGRGRTMIVALSGAARALPTFGFLLLMVLAFGLHPAPLIVVLIILAVPAVLAGSYAGVERVDRSAVNGARAAGFSEWQIATRVELPLALPLIIGGIRSAMLQLIATATIAGFIAQGALGRFLIEGLARRRYEIAVVGAVLVAALALTADGVMAVIQRLARPRGGNGAMPVKSTIRGVS